MQRRRSVFNCRDEVNTNCHVDGIDNFSEFKEINPKEEFLTNFNKYKNTSKHKFYEMDYKIYL